MDSLSCLFHPHHASLIDRHRSLRAALLGLDEDPYYSIDGRSHRNLVAPKFDVRETTSAYLLEGELPGVANKRSISVEWLAGRTLIVRGAIPAHDPLAEWGLKSDDGSSTEVPERPHKTTVDKVLGEGGEEEQKHGRKSSKEKQPRRWLSERRTGEFERSFTFSSEVETDGMKAKLDCGLLQIMVPKKQGEDSTHKIPVE